MRRRWLPVPVVLALALGPGAFAAEPAAAPAPAVSEAARAEQAQEDAIAQALKLVQTQRQAEAIAVLDAVIAHYEALYPAGKTRWFVARDADESLAYMVMAAAAYDRGEGGTATDAHVVLVQWANAWYLKGYALMELERLAEARAALDKAIALAPYNAIYLIERGEAAKLDRDWDAAFGYYRRAEDAVAFSAEDERTVVRGKALRGQAFVFIEKGDYAAAEKLLKRCLELDPADRRAQEELDYIAQLRAKKS